MGLSAFLEKKKGHSHPSTHCCVFPETVESWEVFTGISMPTRSLPHPCIMFSMHVKDPVQSMLLNAAWKDHVYKTMVWQNSRSLTFRLAVQWSCSVWLLGLPSRSMPLICDDIALTLLPKLAVPPPVGLGNADTSCLINSDTLGCGESLYTSPHQE